MRLSLALSPMLWNLSLMACRLSLNWSSFALPGQPLQSAGPWEQDEFWPLIAANFKNKHHPASAPNFIPSLLHTANTIHHLFGLSCDPWSPRMFLKRVGCRSGIVLGIGLRGFLFANHARVRLNE